MFGTKTSAFGSNTRDCRCIRSISGEKHLIFANNLIDICWHKSYFWRHKLYYVGNFVFVRQNPISAGKMDFWWQHLLLGVTVSNFCSRNLIWGANKFNFQCQQFAFWCQAFDCGSKQLIRGASN